MAVTTIPVTNAKPSGIMDVTVPESTFGTPEGARFLNDGKTRILLRNSGAGTHIITIATPKTVTGLNLTVQDPTYSIAAGKTALLPFLDTTYFNDSGGYVTMTSDGTQTEMKAIAVRDLS